MRLYHFTDPRNIESIRRFGLMSWKQLVQRGIKHHPGSNEDSRRIDARKCLENYIHLCLFPMHSMAERAVKQNRIESYVWLTIDDRVIRLGSTLFSDQNATANAAIINDDPNTALSSKHPRAEILVEGSISTKWISFPTEVRSNHLLMSSQLGGPSINADLVSKTTSKTKSSQSAAGKKESTDTDYQNSQDSPNLGIEVGMSMKEVEKRIIYKTLHATKGNRTHAAKTLGISIRTLRNKLNEYRKEVGELEPFRPQRGNPLKIEDLITF